jgi:hypothetical protein
MISPLVKTELEKRMAHGRNLLGRQGSSLDESWFATFKTVTAVFAACGVLIVSISTAWFDGAGVILPLILLFGLYIVLPIVGVFVAAAVLGIAFRVFRRVAGLKCIPTP